MGGNKQVKLCPVKEAYELRVDEDNYAVSSAIVPRFTGYRKYTLPTFEHRYFDATVSDEETFTNLRFLHNWYAALAQVAEKKVPIGVTLTRDYFMALKEPKFAWSEINAFMTGLVLKPRNYRALFERNYLTRMKWGKMV